MSHILVIIVKYKSGECIGYSNVESFRLSLDKLYIRTVMDEPDTYIIPRKEVYSFEVIFR